MKLKLRRCVDEAGGCGGRNQQCKARTTPKSRKYVITVAILIMLRLEVMLGTSGVAQDRDVQGKVGGY